ncbi:hypothetical protein ESCO_003583 [Escovopsis weberi]|uniref:Pre-rRNA processing protein n=1 Tax=Escovopsis weberi TaxID=150374 RepID=A0A0N0RUA5_ESCWE|nr:hypothetical protein ESCO_003583 [Escovopsis weberi]
MTSSHERSPLLSARREPQRSPVSESSPLLYDSCRPRSSSSSRQRDDDGDDDDSDKGSHKEAAGARWPSIIAISGLAVLVVLVMVLGFVAPPAVKFYAERAAVLQPTGLSVEALTQDGVRARIQANFQMDGSRVNDTVAQFLGRMATGVVRKLDTEETTLQLYLPSYDNVLLGTVVVPSLTINLIDGTSTAMDFVTELSIRDSQVLRKIVNDWLDGQVKRLKVTGAMAISIRSGVLPLGTHEVVESMVFEAKDIPTIPDYDIGQIKIRDVPLGGGGRMAVGANVSLIVYNDYPVSLTLPSLGFDILVPNCDASEAHIKVASATTGSVPVQPHVNVTVDAFGLIKGLPESLVRACPESDMSPLDVFMKEYLHGGNARVFVRGQQSGDIGVPDWIGSILASTAVPIDLPGRSFDNAIRNISVSNIDFKLPSPFADPDTPQGKTQVSGTLQVLAAVPRDLQLGMDVNGLQASSDVFYQGKKFGELNVRSWQKAESERLPGGDDDGNDDDDVGDLMMITSRLSQVPLDITDGDVFSDVVQQLLFGDADLLLDISSLVDARVSTAIGALVVKEIPARGKMPIKHIPRELFGDVDIHVRDVAVVGTSKSSVRMRAAVDLVNPTPYTASIPFASAHVLTADGHLIGEISCRNLDLGLGQNKDLVVYAAWDPVAMGGKVGHQAARKLLSDYISGENTTLTLRAHRDSIPVAPLLGEALSKINITLPTPRIQLPPDDNDDNDNDGNNGDPNTRFLRNTIFHIFSSTATFNLASPLKYNTIHIERINATAFYDHTEPVGDILYNEPFDAPPGISPTPRLPVAWSLDSIGWDKLRDALGGSLRLDARAEVRLRIGSWRETLTYAGRGIGAHIRL